MSWFEFALGALVLGLLVKTNLIEDRVKKLGEHAHEEAEEGGDGDAGRECDSAFNERPFMKEGKGC